MTPTPLRIWGRLSSINVRKVVLCAQELGLAFVRTDAGAQFGIVRTPQYLAHNPNALVPLLDEGDFHLWESNVIVRYLCATHAAGTLYPTGLRERFDAERWMDWQQTTLNPAGRDAFVQRVRVPAGQRDAALIERSVAQTSALLDMLEQHLSRQPWMASDRLTMADLPIACELHRWWGQAENAGSRDAFPALARWYARMQSRPAARGVLDIELS